MNVINIECLILCYFGNQISAEIKSANHLTTRNARNFLFMSSSDVKILQSSNKWLICPPQLRPCAWNTRQVEVWGGGGCVNYYSCGRPHIANFGAQRGAYAAVFIF